MLPVAIVTTTTTTKTTETTTYSKGNVNVSELGVTGVYLKKVGITIS